MTACLNKYVEQTSTMVTRILTLVRVRTAPAAIAGQCSSSTQNTHNQNYRRLFNDDEKIILPAAAASAVEAKKEDDLNHGEHQLREAEATVAVARPSNNVDNDPHHAASQRKKRQRSGSEGEDVVPKKTARKKHKRLCSADGCKNKFQREGVCFRHGAKAKLCSAEGCTILLKMKE